MGMAACVVTQNRHPIATMAPWRKACLQLAGLAVLFGLMSLLLRDPQPRYRHVPLSQWLVLDAAYKHRLRPEHFLNQPLRPTTLLQVRDLDTLGPEASQAIRGIGTNAIPWLIKWMSVPRRSWKWKIGGVMRRLPRAVQPDTVPEWMDRWRDYEQSSLAYRGFVVLGAEAAATVIPELTKLACESWAVGADNAVDLLAGLDPPAVPELVRVLTSNPPNKDIRDRVLARLGCQLATFPWSGALVLRSVAGPDKEPAAWSAAVRDLVTCLKDPDEEVAAWTATTLGRIRPPPELAIPALIAALDDSRPQVRLAALKALGDFGSAATTATPELKVLSGNPDTALAEEAERALLNITPPWWPN